ncbi:MAG: type II toxin-antitoxin system VapC family toxin [Candidatus Aenigmarchaeota archaeon]|nr:type II toxin-antitoxin system VapC family toxin [Candidatus Aenigmarchaeota archaeon]
MMYLDANVFLYALLYTDERGKTAAALIQAVREGREQACTATLTADEVAWEVQIARGREAAARALTAFLEMRHLEVVDVTREILWQARDLLANGLDPRDAIHAACCLQKGAAMISEDADFDRVPGLKRRWIF